MNRVRRGWRNLNAMGSAMKRRYIVTLWSGGQPGKKWKTEEEPQLLPTGTGVDFVDVSTKLPVRIIGDISVEEYEEGREEFEREPGLPPVDED